ncbi:uncharacterized protein LOC124154639 isoform X2 [Ischnura elegans]|uniref:uncharacterized protein LOC124154639 isoform X2 n=1 Tax=Ischnura elegans TaxID=197161 RepID=UPI001ED8B634|nr:uncharacterized protein LOC124154639 isoform X2 [Ischnura elegans]
MLVRRHVSSSFLNAKARIGGYLLRKWRKLVQKPRRRGLKVLLLRLPTKSKTSKDLVAQSQPLPMKSNQSNHMNLGKKYEFETKTEEKEDPFSMECSTKEKKLDNTMSQNQTVNDEDQINTEAFLVPQRDDIFEFREAINECMTEEEIIITDSLNNNGSVEDESSEDPVRPYTVQEVQAVDSMQQNSSGKGINCANEKSVCSCSLRIDRSRENLVKISGELKNISNIIENIKKELEKHTK